MKTTLNPFHGSRGVLQTIGFTDNPRGVKVRHKLAQTDTDSSKTR